MAGENRRKKVWPPVAEVAGTVGGVPFRQTFKRAECARNLAQQGGVLTYLDTYRSYKWRNGKWVECYPNGDPLPNVGEGEKTE